MTAMVQASLGPPAPKYQKEDPPPGPPPVLDDPRQNQHPASSHTPQLQHPRSTGIIHQHSHDQKSPHQSNTSIPPQSPYASSPHVLGNGIPLQRQSPYGPPSQEPAYYPSQHGAYATTTAPGQYPSTEAPDLMATAQMQRPYPPIYHTPQSNSPASVPSPQTHDQHGRSLYGQPPQMPQGMYGYPQFPPMNPVHSAPYAHPATQHPQLTSQPLLVGHQTSAPQMQQHQHQQQQPHPSTMTNSPRMKLEGTPQQPAQPQRAPLNTSHPGPSATPLPTSHSSASGSNTSAAPGPIPATTPLVVRQDSSGVQWIAFEYSRDRVKMEYTIRCDVESINIDHLSQEFKTENCVYPRACCSKDQYRGNRLVYETECNAVGWALAELNPCLRGKRGLIQRAVDSWRNSNQDPRLRSRRVRRMAKLNNRKAVSAQHAPHLAGPGGPAPPTGIPSTTSLAAAGSMAMGNAQLHHHHAHPDAPSGEDVSGTSHYGNGTDRSSANHPTYAPGPSPADLRPSHMFHGYPTYPHPASSSTAAGGPSMAPPLRDSGIDHLGRPSTVATSSSSASKRDLSPTDNTALFGDLPEGRRRKFILVEDPQRGSRVRVKVMLDQVDMNEIPDSYRKSNSVFPRTYYPVQSPFGETGRGRRFDSDGGSDAGPADDVDSATVGRTLVPVPMLEGEGNLAVPKIAKRKRAKEERLNELGYRMSWGQSRVFAGRTLFLQRALDAYRNKMRSSMLTSGQETTEVAPHFETRVGKRKWLERSRRGRSSNATAGQETDSTAAVNTSASARSAEEVEP
ncbi:hypothetical protein AJ80_00598 [Polytolypa hystricis UAMH7299]|uniref:DUF8032 domain-containing protein n=1 Tax=Polytolypa hystricis (strain UAMH7299) TaxID=1447883 RepID=A0A2B7Z329_POLH7|nr:hypothetical protein AJ80_00598 [Polytolypa hystricis UAMH7299]